MARPTRLYQEVVKRVPEQKGKPLIAAGVALAIRRGMNSDLVRTYSGYVGALAVAHSPLRDTGKLATDEELIQAITDIECSK
jgi:hypothetical protein